MPRNLDVIRAENAKFSRMTTRAHSLGMQMTVWLHELLYAFEVPYHAFSGERAYPWLAKVW